MPLSPGARLGPCEIVAALGAGGMGEVYKAIDRRLDRTVAIKVLNADLAADPQFRDRFDREARTVSQLTHPHICTLYDVGRHDDTSYLVLEFLEGETLADRLARTPAMSIAEALRIAAQIADALAAAHRAGIVHRDLKPGNVMLMKGGAKLLDFGLAKQGTLPRRAGPLALAASPGPKDPALTLGADLTAAPTLTSPLTMQGSFVGTLLYMSPEQLQGAEADTRSDIFAFGAVLYEMLTGRKAFTGRSQVSVMAAILDQDPPPIATLQPTAPPALDRIVRQCLEKDPEARWQNARDLQSEIEWIAETSSQPAGPVTRRHETDTARTRWTWIAAAAVLVIAASAAAWFASRSRLPPAKLQVMRFAIVPSAALALAPTNTDRQLAITPDGTKIVYVALGTTAGTGQLMVRAIDRLEAEPLRGTEGARFPFISPDGKWIGFFLGTLELKKIPIAGGPSTVLCRINGTPRGASWGPDDTIVFATVYAETGHVVYAAAGTLRAARFDPIKRELLGDPTPVVEQVGMLNTGATQFGLSRTGALVFVPGGFVSVAGAGTVRSLVWVDRQGHEESIKAPPRAYFALQISTAGGTKAVWGRSGRELFYVDGGGVLMTVPSQTTTAFSNGIPAKLLEAKYFHDVQQSRSYDVSRDGQRFLMIKDAPAANGRTATPTPAGMVVVLNWFEELKQRLPVR